MSVIHTENLTKSYGSRRGVDDVNLTVNPGEIFGFLGPNGAGKSTTIRMLLGFLKASSGKASVFGLDCWADSESIKRDVGYVAGDVRLYSWLTTRNALKIVSEIRKMDLFAEGLSLDERFRLEVDLPVRKMSRGNRQKVAIVLALVHQPRLVVLDEPTSGLDPLMQGVLMDRLRELATQGHTVFFSSHTLSEVESICDRVAIVRDGRIVADKGLAEMKLSASRSVAVRFANDDAARTVRIPEFVQLESRSGTTLQLKLTGSAVELTKWAASQSISDITIGAPNLESLFRAYYTQQPKSEAEASDEPTVFAGEEVS